MIKSNCFGLRTVRDVVGYGSFECMRERERERERERKWGLNNKKKINY